MDDKEKQLIAELHGRIVALDFDELDVFCLVTSLRDPAPRGSPVHECGNFLAHRRRNEGVIFEYFQGVLAEIARVQTDPTAYPPIKPVYTYRDIADCLNGRFDGLGLMRWSVEQVENAILCIMSLLQDVRLVRNGQEVGRLVLGTEGDNFVLSGQVPFAVKGGNAFFDFDVLKVANHARLDPLVKLQAVKYHVAPEARSSLIILPGRSRAGDPPMRVPAPPWLVVLLREKDVLQAMELQAKSLHRAG